MKNYLVIEKGKHSKDYKSPLPQTLVSEAFDEISSTAILCRLSINNFQSIRMNKLENKFSYMIFLFILFIGNNIPDSKTTDR